MPNVTADHFRQFVETFHSVLDETGSACLTPDNKAQLLHVALLPANITAYVSTQHGVAIEYESTSQTTINIIRGSARVEDLLVKVPRFLRNLRPLIDVPTSNIWIEGFTVEGTFRLTSSRASLTFKNVDFRAGEWTRRIEFAEVWANRAAENWSPERAELRAKDEVLAGMVEAARAQERQVSVSEYIATFKSKTVLVLGAYDRLGLGRLTAIAKALADIGYSPLLIKDVPDHPHHDLSQKVSAVGTISRFIVIDDSAKSGHLVEAQICKQNAWVTALVRAKGEFSSWMTAGFSTSSNVLLEHEYDPNDPLTAMKRVSEWAERTLNELQRKFTNTYPWRSED